VKAARALVAPPSTSTVWSSAKATVAFATPLRQACAQRHVGRLRTSAAKCGSLASTHTPRHPKSRSSAKVCDKLTPSLAPTSTKYSGAELEPAGRRCGYTYSKQRQ
jgi:hypothetical protein